MEYFAGLDVSMAETHVCVMDRDGIVIYEVKVPSHWRHPAGLEYDTPTGRYLCERGGNTNPIDRRCDGRVRHACQFNFYNALGTLQRETFERLVEAGDDIMPVGSTEASGRYTTNAAQADHGHG